MAPPDFTQPQPEISINGFPIRFRRENLDGKTILWVPKRISRSLESKGWRILINHANGQSYLWEPDDRREPLDSLQTAWERMVLELNQLTTTITNMRRPLKRGPKRNPAIDTGVDGVLITRTKARPGRSKAVGVCLFQWVISEEGMPKSKGVSVFSISESKFLKAPADSQWRFHQALCIATAIRHRYLETVATDGTPRNVITANDLMPEDVPSSPVRALGLPEIFDSIDVPDSQMP